MILEYLKEEKDPFIPKNKLFALQISIKTRRFQYTKLTPSPQEIQFERDLET